MAFRSMASRIAALALLLAALAFPAPVLAGGAKSIRKTTHLGVAPKHVINVRSFTLPNDNTGEHLFYYDRDDSSPFSVPDGYSFVVTDVIVLPDAAAVNATQQTSVFVSLGFGRSFPVHYASAEVRHFALAGALIVPGGTTPTARNITDSTQACDVQMLGYFLKAQALESGESPFPAP